MSDLVIGCGEIGKPLADILLLTRPTYTIDKKEELCSDAIPCHGIEVMHICYPYLPERRGDFIDSVVIYAQRYKPHNVIIHSTVLPGTTRAIHSRLRTYQKTFYSPVRGRHTQMYADLMRYQKFIAAAHKPDLDAGIDLLMERNFRPGVMETPETLELAKLLETTYSGLLIAWAQEMERFAQAAKADREEALLFTEEVDYLPAYVFYPGHIGGHCIMQNLDLLDILRGGSPIVEAIRESNEGIMPAFPVVRHRPRRIR